MKPFLKWAGGKSKLVNVISECLGDGKRLVEPFVGSASVFLGTNYKNNLLCDVNKDLIMLYKNIQNNHKKFIKDLEKVFDYKNNTETAYYELRSEFNTLESEDLRKSILFVYLNKHAFNGLCRYNKKGFFNVPYGKYAAPKAPVEQVNEFYKKSLTADFRCLDFKGTFELLDEGDVVYCDPPYVPASNTASFTAYAKEDFNYESQTKLALEAERISSNGIKVVISNSDNEFTRNIYSKAKIIELSVMRNISSKATTRGKAKEIIAIY